jgi:hypothetical protein
MTTAEFQAAYLEARINAFRVQGDRVAMKLADAASRKIENAARKAGRSIDANVYDLDDKAQRIVMFPNHADHALSYTANMMVCIDCNCAASA